MKNPEAIHDGQIVIKLDWCPPGLNEYSRMHWTKQRGLKKRLVREIWAYMGEHKIKKPAEPLTAVKIYAERRNTGKVMDEDNAQTALKGVLDALQELGILADDSPDVIREQSLVPVRCKHRKDAGLKIVIDPI